MKLCLKEASVAGAEVKAEGSSKVKTLAAVAAIAAANVLGCASTTQNVAKDATTDRAENVVQPQAGCPADAVDCEITFEGGYHRPNGHEAPAQSLPLGSAHQGAELK